MYYDIRFIQLGHSDQNIYVYSPLNFNLACYSGRAWLRDCLRVNSKHILIIIYASIVRFDG